MEVAIVSLVILVSIVLFVTEALRADTVALLAMTTLLVTGVCSPEEGLAGFSNEATITVAAMFVLSAGLEQTGTLAPISRTIAALIQRKGVLVPLLAMCLVVGIVSAFINNTAAVAIFLPAIMAATRQAGVGPARFLMPLSFVAMAGGTITLIGTSTNLLVNAEATRHGLPAIGMFEFAPLGLILLGASILYTLTLGNKLVPDRRPPADLTEDYQMGPHLSALKVLPGGASDRYTLKESALRDLKGDILGLSRKDIDWKASEDTLLEPDDALKVRLDDPEELEKESETLGVALEPKQLSDRDLENDEAVLVEAGVASNIEGSTLKDQDVRQAFDAVPLAVSRRGKVQHQGLEDFRLRSGDTILFRVERDRLDRLRLSRNFFILSEQERRHTPRRSAIAVGIISLVVGVAALDFAPIVVTAVVGAVAMVLTGCLTTEQAYKAIDWKVIFLLAGMLSLGSAMETSGAARMLAEFMVHQVAEAGPQFTLGCIYLITTLLTATMSNNATAVLLAPVAISIADAMQVSPRPFLVAVAFAASACFASPVGYQTNVMVYGPGRFKFRDFLLVGGPLNLLFLILSVLLIPVFWSF